eukprot:scaffold3118_cov64-Cylindrotheca_fusiformis.AAC.18
MWHVNKNKTKFKEFRRSHNPQPPSTTDSNNDINQKGRCALCFFGLPRSYKTMVLPSIERNILPRNPDCDIFVHFFYQKEEAAGRSNDGGKVDPNEVLLLRNSIQNSSSSPRVVKFMNETREIFFQKRQVQLWRYRETYSKVGKPLYYPWKHPSWDKSSLDNMIAQWHSIEGAFNLMEDHAKQNHIEYTRVAMLRNDVLYLTPIDITQLDNETVDSENQRFVVPNFCKYPVNDRMIYGPYDAVKVWSTERFRLIEKRVQQPDKAGSVMHSEHFMNDSIFSTITQQYGYEMHRNPDICFLRTRADSMALTNDCKAKGKVRGFQKNVNLKPLIEETVGRKCTLEKREFNKGRGRGIVQCFDQLDGNAKNFNTSVR